MCPNENYPHFRKSTHQISCTDHLVCPKTIHSVATFHEQTCRTAQIQQQTQTQPHWLLNWSTGVVTQIASFGLSENIKTVKHIKYCAHNGDTTISYTTHSSHTGDTQISNTAHARTTFIMLEDGLHNSSWNIRPHEYLSIIVWLHWCNKHSIKTVSNATSAMCMWRMSNTAHPCTMQTHLEPLATRQMVSTTAHMSIKKRGNVITRMCNDVLTKQLHTRHSRRGETW